MPLYEFQCVQCGAEFEMILRFSESDQKPDCPRCQGKFTRKKLAQVAAIGASQTASGNASSASCGSSGSGFR